MLLAAGVSCHYGGYSTDQVRSARLFYLLRSRLLYARKHWRRMESVVLWVLTFTVVLLGNLTMAITRWSSRDLVATIRAYG